MRGYPLREKNGCRSSRKCGYIYSKIRITIFQNHHCKNADSTHELSLKSELKSMRLSSILTRTKMSRFNILLSGKCSTNINRRQATFQSGSCKVRNTAVSMSATTKTTKSGKIRFLDSHEPSEPFCCWRRSHLRRRHSRIRQGCQVPNRSPLPLGKDCIGKRGRDRTSSPV